VQAHGTASSGTTVFAGGTLDVFHGGVTSNTVVSSGGIEYDYGSATGDTIYGGGLQVVEPGGIASATTLHGGTLEVASGASISGPISFTSAGGDLQLDASQSFHGLIAGFASPSGVTEEIDLLFEDRRGALAKSASPQIVLQKSPWRD
jgi:autotransporter passenger strand-loop-strand repeat protein